MKIALFAGAALAAAIITPFAVTVVGAAAPRPSATAVLAMPVTAIQAMREIEQDRGEIDAARAAQPVPANPSCSRPVRVVGTGYGEPVVCRR
ncbi:MAG: hypothetical protein O9972_20620 [Burkholderiales bacterium]|nr:hypothetical protein [Burkholderiales bacterium]